MKKNKKKITVIRKRQVYPKLRIGERVEKILEANQVQVKRFENWEPSTIFDI